MSREAHRLGRAASAALAATLSGALPGACYHMEADRLSSAPDGGDGGDTGADASEDTGPPCEGPGVWYDENFGHCWENPAPGGLTDGWGASNYCAELELAGHAGWQLPDVDALRSLIRGCMITDPNGSCQVHHGSSMDDWNEPCVGCVGDGPGSDGCYWPEEVGGPCGVHYWSSSALPENSTFVWYVDYDDASVGFVHKENVGYVRCVLAAE